MMAMRIGHILQGVKGKYELPLKGSSVFKARVLSNASIQPEWAALQDILMLQNLRLTVGRTMIKSATKDGENMCLQREYNNYK